MAFVNLDDPAVLSQYTERLNNDKYLMTLHCDSHLPKSKNICTMKQAVPIAPRLYIEYVECTAPVIICRGCLDNLPQIDLDELIHGRELACEDNKCAVYARVPVHKLEDE